jgi:hypothetical protein
MYDQVDKWLAGDWALLGTHVPHWALALAAVILVALFVAWFERPKRAPARSLSTPHTGGRPTAAEPRERSVA